MARIISPRNILLLITTCVMQWVNFEEHCEPRDLRDVVLYVRELRTEIQKFKDYTKGELNELKSTMEKLDELRKMIQQNITCPEGWEKNGRSCYYFNEAYLTFYDAEEFCKNRSAHLVHVNDETENDPK